MIETIKAILLDFQETRFETGVARHLQIETVPGKASVGIGARRMWISSSRRVANRSG